MQDFAERYTAAWNSGIPERVAAHFAEDGWLRVNNGETARGRESITALALGFMQAFPDLSLSCDGLMEDEGAVTYRWTLRGTYAGTGRKVEISGREIWKMGADGLVAESEGNFDAADYARQCGL